MRAITIISFFLFFVHAIGQETYLEEELLPDVGYPTNCIASPDPIVIDQPDNTQLTIVGKGTMINYRTESIDGYTLVLNDEGVYEYAELENGNFKASGIKANDPSERNFLETSYLTAVSPSLQEAPNPLKASILDQVNKQVLSKVYPTTGSVNVLALLIEFKDLKHKIGPTVFDSLLNGMNYNNGKGSFKTYYRDASKGQLTVNVDIVGWIEIDTGYIYFGRDSGSARAADLVRMGVDSAKQRGVNFSKYDNNNDGFVDGIMAIHSGPGAEVGSRTQYIWSHRWVLRGGTLGRVRYDGVWIDDYMINPEVHSGTNVTGIGVICHEFGHNLGLPDLYDTDDSNGKSEGIGEWGVMGGGSWLGNGHTPGGFCAWSRVQVGWDTPTLLEVGTNVGNYTLRAASNTKDEIFRINTPVSSEYFLLENRQKVGVDVGLPGTGLAIWHINTLKTNAPGNQVNGDANLKGVDLEEADGLDDLDKRNNRGDNGDLFPGLTNNRTFNDQTYPNSKTYNSANTGIKISNITENNQIITFDFGSTLDCAADTLRGKTGTFSDKSGKGKYLNNLSCSWLIKPTTPTQDITLSFLAFRTQASQDVVTIYDGIDNTAPVLAAYSGTTIPASVTSSYGEMYIEFKTNGSVVDSGWTAHYTTNDLVDSISILQDTIFIADSVNSTAQFSVTSNTEWDVVLNDSWLSVTPMNGNRNMEVDVLVTQKNTGIIRTAMIYVKTKGKEEIDSVVVVQDGIQPVLTHTPDTVTLGYIKNQHDFINVTSNVPVWTVTSNNSWIGVSPTQSGLDDIIVITAEETNTTLSERSGSITITAAPLEPIEIIVIQNTGSTGIEKNSLENQLSVYPNPTVGEVNIRVNDNMDLGNMKLSLYNSIGAKVDVRIKQSSNNIATLYLNEFPFGVYYLVIDYEGNRLSKKISVVGR